MTDAWREHWQARDETPRGRPPAKESQRRALRFAELVAGDDTRLEEHARTAGIDPYRALRLLSDPEFRALVDSLDRAAA